MTSLKVKYADEIVDEMVRLLDTPEFKEMEQIRRTAALQKEAGPAFEAFKKDVDVAAGAGTDLELVYSKHANALAQEDNTEPGTVQKAREYMAEKGRGKQPGLAMPPATEGTLADDVCAECDDPRVMAAVEFTLKHLVKVADALDGRGFAELAGLVDEAIEKIASKKKITKAAADWTLLPDGKWRAPSGEVMTADKAKAMAKALGTPLPVPQPAPGSAGSVAPWQSMPQSMDPAAEAKKKQDEEFRHLREYMGEGGAPMKLHKAPGTKKKFPVTPIHHSPVFDLQKHLVYWTQMPVSKKGGPDGKWGPKTVAAWNAALKKLQEQGYEVDPSIKPLDPAAPMPAAGTVKLFNSLLMRYSSVKPPAKKEEAGKAAPAPDLAKQVPGPGEVKTGPAAKEHIPGGR